jgi:NAD(P)-dependent dehydrogenase (short-subunit alcohol dehydrogenase family)
VGGGELRQEDPVAGQVVVVTGGGGVIGRAICAAFARAGARVAVAGRTDASLIATVRRIVQAGGRALDVQVDVADPESVERMAARVERELGPVDLLVNNAGQLGALGPLWEADPDEWWRTWEVNVRGVMLCARAVLPGMVARRRGRIITMSSGSVLGPVPAFSAYPASKTAVTRLTEQLALDCRPYGIGVFAITPGLVYSPMTRRLWESADGQRWTAGYEDVYAERHVPPELVAERCLALATGRADRLSGCYIQLADDLDELIRRADAIAADGLYTLRIRGETATPTTPRVAGRSGDGAPAAGRAAPGRSPTGRPRPGTRPRRG